MYVTTLNAVFHDSHSLKDKSNLGTHFCVFIVAKPLLIPFQANPFVFFEGFNRSSVLEACVVV